MDSYSAEKVRRNLRGDSMHAGGGSVNGLGIRASLRGAYAKVHNIMMCKLLICKSPPGKMMRT